MPFNQFDHLTIHVGWQQSRILLCPQLSCNSQYNRKASWMDSYVQLLRYEQDHSTNSFSGDGDNISTRVWRVHKQVSDECQLEFLWTLFSQCGPEAFVRLQIPTSSQCSRVEANQGGLNLRSAILTANAFAPQTLANPELRRPSAHSLPTQSSQLFVDPRPTSVWRDMNSSTSPP